MTDTSPEIAEMVRARLMALSGAERFRMGVQMFDAAGAWCWPRCPLTFPKPNASAASSSAFTALPCRCAYETQRTRPSDHQASTLCVAHQARPAPAIPSMSKAGISVPYNRDLKPLEKLLSGVRRPGDFFVLGSLETPMPRVEVGGVGVISFPVPEPQIQQIIQQATRAPYGRGEETIHDESVRKTWQLPASMVQVGGKTWEKTFSQLLATVVDGLGCAEAKVSAELYKLLVYDPGGFFAAHRDTEKAGGMFGTLVVTLPSAHRGGELLIRHAGREVVADLSSEEFSELKFAAFYADCEHEVRPVTRGHRVCLVFNLIQLPGGKASEPLSAPLYSSEIETAAGMLEEAFATSGAPAKLAWLLKHQYSPTGLSFSALKGEDVALAKVLRAAADRAGCAVHLGIVHIEESGPAQPDYDAGYGYRRRRRWHSYNEEEVQEDASSDSFEVIEVSDGSRHIDQWVNTQDQMVAYGQLPLEDGEVLPAGELDDEDPDEQRLMEATGNEGASFERSYHRAALVIWPKERFAGVLIQAGVGAALRTWRNGSQQTTRPPPGSRGKSSTPGSNRPQPGRIAVWRRNRAGQR